MPFTETSPGPFEVTGQSEGGRYITVKAANGRVVARVPWNTPREADKGICTDQADATLLAASDDMMRALLGLLRDNPEARGAEWDRARAAVRKGGGFA